MRFSTFASILITAIAFAVVTSPATAHADGTDELAELRRAVLELVRRVESLEAEVRDLQSQLAARSDADDLFHDATTADDTELDAGDDANVFDRTMLLERVEPLPRDASADEEIARLRAAAAEYKAKAEAADREAIEAAKRPLSASRTHYHLHGGTCKTCKQWKDEHELECRRESRALRNQAVDLRREWRRHDGQATRLEKQAAEPRHRLTGWQDGRRVVLLTSRNLLALIEKIDAGRCVGWKGRLTHADESIDTWNVHFVEPVECPPDER